MGNSQSYDVTNVHHRNTHERDETAGTVKPLRNDIMPIIDANEKEKQENKSPKSSADHQQLPEETQHQEKLEDITEIPKEPSNVVQMTKSDENVTDVTHGMSEIALESLYRDVPPETLPLDAKPTQSSYD